MSNLLLEFYQTVGLFKIVIFAAHAIIIAFICRGVRLRIIGVLSVFLWIGLLVALDVQERRDFDGAVATYSKQIKQFENLITQQKLTISHREEVIGYQVAEIIDQHPELKNLYWQATQFDPKLADQFLAAYINASNPEGAQIFAARDASRVFIRRWRNELDTADDSIFHLLAPDYLRIFKIMKNSDPQLCTTYLSGRWAFYGEAYSPMLNFVAKLYFNLSFPSEQKTYGSKQEALDFGVKVLGDVRLKKLMAREGTFTEVCDDLITIFEELERQQTPQTAAASRFWIQPAKFYN
jgi:hypothetical protein